MSCQDRTQPAFFPCFVRLIQCNLTEYVLRIWSNVHLIYFLLPSVIIIFRSFSTKRSLSQKYSSSSIVIRVTSLDIWLIAISSSVFLFILLLYLCQIYKGREMTDCSICGCFRIEAVKHNIFQIKISTTSFTNMNHICNNVICWKWEKTVWWGFRLQINSVPIHSVIFFVCMCVSEYCCREGCAEHPLRKSLTATLSSTGFTSAGNIVSVKRFCLVERVIVRFVVGPHPKVLQEILEIKLSHREGFSWRVLFSK